MQIHPLHSWDLSVSDAIQLQKELAAKLDTSTPLPVCDTIAGADISYAIGSEVCFAAVVVLRTTDYQIIEVQEAVRTVTFPYVPGLLSFREIPLLLDAFAKVTTPVDAVMFDGQGIAHPRRLGLAAHAGLWLEVPTLGCGKSRLCGRFEEPAATAGSHTPLCDRDEIIGSVVRTKNRCKPVYVSPGHRLDLDSAIRLALQSARGYRIPEPTRQAHLHVNELRRRQSS